MLDCPEKDARTVMGILLSNWGLVPKKMKRVTKPLRGHFQRSGVSSYTMVARVSR